MSEPIVPKLHTPVHLVYTATVGRHYETYLRALSEGRIVGGVCSATGRVYVPPRGASPMSGRPTDEIVEVAQVGILTTFCIVRIPFEGQRLTPPYVFGAIVLDGAHVPIYHLVSGCPLEEIRMGMRVRAVWKPREAWGPTLESIAHFEPTGEPDAPFESYAEFL
ncbi:MAG: Zn-ribbon domain-containing OB-fold protein [Polyangiales bacterium]